MPLYKKVILDVNNLVPENIKDGVTILSVTGTLVEATALTGDAVVADVLDGKFFYKDDAATKLEGTMPNNSSNNVEVTDVDGTLIPTGFYDGTGSAVLSAAEAAKVIDTNIRSGVTLLGVAGNANVVNTSSGTAAAGDILATKVAWVDGSEITGSMANKGANNVEVDDVDGTLIPAGYYNGSGSAVLSAAEAAKVVTGNIKAGVTLLGVAGAANVVDTTSGDAVAGEILTGKKAWVDGTEITGTMADNEGDNVATSSSVDGTTLKLVAPTGFYDGTDTVTITDADFAAANIKDTVNIFGIVGTYAAGGSVLTGDAIAAEVLDGKFFYSNDPDTKLEGTMVNNAGDTAATSNHAGAAGEIHVVPSVGFYDGSDDAAVITDADFVAANIADGVTVFGITGTLVGSSVLTGDAAVTDVLAPKTFYADDPDTELTGTLYLMPSTLKGALYDKKSRNSAALDTNHWYDGLYNTYQINHTASSYKYDLTEKNIKAGEVFEVSYFADVLPDAAYPAWTVTSTSSSQSIIDGLLTMVSGETAGDLIESKMVVSGITAAAVKVVECRVRILDDSEAYGGFLVAIGDGTRMAIAVFRQNGDIKYLNNSGAWTNGATGHINTDFFNIRLEFDSSTGFKIYKNGTQVGSTIGYTSLLADANKWIRWDTRNDSGYQGSAELKYFRYTLSDATDSTPTVVWLAKTSTGTLTKAWVEPYATLGTGGITYYISRDNGSTFTECTPDTLTDISGQPSGTSIVLKAEITGDAELHAIAWGGST